MFKFINRFRLRYRSFGKVGNNVTIKKGYFAHSSNIIIGNDVYIGPFAYWDALGGIEIDDNVIIGPQVVIWSYNHNFRSEEYLPYDGIELLKKVSIRSNVWIGLGAKILPGVTIHEGSIVGMGAVVKEDVPPLSIVFGNPAVTIGTRNHDIYERLKAEGRSYLKAKSTGQIVKALKQYAE